MSSCSLCVLAPDNGAYHRTSTGDKQLLCLLSHQACLPCPQPCCLEVHSPRNVFASQFAALLSTIGTSVNMLLHYCEKCQYVQPLIAHHFKSKVSLVSHYILQPPCLYCWCPLGSKPGDTSCNESLLNSDIFSPGFGFGSSLVRCSLAINHTNSYYMCTETLSTLISEIIWCHNTL